MAVSPISPVLLALLTLYTLYQPCRTNSVEGWTEYVRVNMLQEVLENQYLRTPIALVLDINARTVQSFKKLWYETAEQGLPDRHIMFFPVSEKDIGSAGMYNSERLSSVLGELHPAAEASVEEESVTGRLFTAALAATGKLPFDSAVLLVTGGSPTDTKLAPRAAEMLIRKRARLYVIWTGTQSGDENVLREIALLTGGAMYYMETNAVIRTRMLRIENADLDQTIINRNDVVDRLESSFTVPDGDPGFTIKLVGNLSRASLIDPQGNSRNLLLTGIQDEVTEVTDILVTTKGMPSGAWLLITEGVDNTTYDVHVLKLVDQTTDESSTDDDVIENLDEENSTVRLRREAPGLDDADLKSARLAFPTEKPHNESSQIVAAVLGEQRSVTPVSVPFIVELASGSNLEVRPGATATLQFDVTNNLNLDATVTFSAIGKGVFVQSVQPTQSLLQAGTTSKVQVNVASQQATGTATLTFNVYWVQGNRITSRTAQLSFTASSTSDSWSPNIDYRFTGDCRQFETPATCNNGQWSVDATVKDDESGLLRVMSEPFGLIFSSEFIAGTRSPVNVQYTASCCKPRVDIWAEDLRGNYRRRSFDVFHQGLLDGEIAAVVLGVLLLIIIILLIVVLVLFCRRRRSDRIVLPRHRAGSR